MKRRGKIIATITTMCLALVMLAFGVYASTIVSFDIGGKVSYKIEDAYVNITTKIYSHNMYSANRNAEESSMVEQYGAMLASLGVTAYPNAELYNKVEELSSTKLSEIDTNEYNLVKEYSYSSVTDGEPTPITDLDLEFNSTNALTYFIVINIENLTDEPVYAVIQDNILNAENTVQLNTGVQQNIVKGEENRNIVIGFGIADLTTPIDENSATKAFSYGIKVGLGDITETEENKAKLSINYNSSLGGYLASINQTAKGAVVVPATYDDGTNNEKNVVATAPIKTPSGTTIAAMLELINPGVTCVVLPNSVTRILDASFAVNVALTKITGLENVQSFGTYALAGCISLAKVSLPTNYMAGSYSFYSCASLDTFDIPTNMTSVPEYMLGDCTSLTSIDLKNVTSIGNDAFYRCTGLTSVNIPDSVTSIGNDAFSGCTGLTSIIIPDSVSTIGNWAFSHCTGLKSVLIEEGGENLEIGDSAFCDCTGLTSVNIPDSVTSIGNDAFSGCTGLTSIIIPDSVSTIGNWAFYSCTGLKSVLIEEGGENLEIGDSAFCDCTGLTSIIIPDSVETIGDWVFSHCTGLTSVTIPDSVSTIGQAAFSNSGLTSVTIPDSVTSIGNHAFYNCIGLKSVLIEEGGENLEIGDSAFKSCDSLTSITIPDSVETIGYQAFSYCSGLTSVTIPDSVTSIGDSAFSGSGLTGVTIPDSVTSIGDSAFSSCRSLTSVTIPDSVSTIGVGAFAYCSGLTSVTFGSGVKSIGDSAFKSCDSLTSITIPDSVSTIGDSAFDDCDDLKNISIGDNIEKIGRDAFEYTKYYNTSSNWQNNLLYLTSRGNKKYLISAKSSLSGDFNLPADVQAVANGVLSETSLTNITVDENNPRYTSKIGGVETNSIIRVGEDDTYTLVTGNLNSTLVEGITAIGDKTFYSCSGLTGNLVIPDSVTSIGERAFTYCEGLTSITIPDSVTSIGEDAFYGWTEDQSIYFEGTSMPENLASGWNDYCNAKIYLNGELWTGA